MHGLREKRSPSAHKTFFPVAALLVGITVCLVALADFGLGTLSAARAYVGGEGRWSRAQKNAVHDLLRYAASRDERYYRDFLSEMAVPLGDRRARLEMEKASPDVAVISEGFLAGGIEKADIADMVRLFRRFGRIDPVARALRAWETGDVEIAALMRAGEHLRAMVASGKALSGTGLPDEIDRINARATELENSFSQSLGEAARWARKLLVGMTIATASILVLIGVIVLRGFFERIKAGEDTLRESERRFRALIQNSSDGIAVLAADGAVRFRSSSGERILGHEQPRHFIEAVHPDDRAALELRLSEVLAHPGEPLTATYRFWHPAGSWRVLESLFINLLADSAIAGVVCNFRDVTDRKKFEAQLLASDRMVSIGTLASGIAHEINNPLASAIANLSYLSEELGPALEQEPSGAEAREALRETRLELDRVREIVRGLKTFSRGDEEHRARVDVRGVLDSSIDLAWNELHHRARVVRNYGSDLPAVLVNEARLGQVFVSLLLNAAHAIQIGGAAMNEIRIRAISSAGEVIVEVKDTGAGIAPEHSAQVFDPFFTTKPIGEGTGLGLFVCRNILAAQGGKISFESELGKGTTFRVALPAAEGAPAEPCSAA
jgi:PAS domain S-box-containing protein